MKIHHFCDHKMLVNIFATNFSSLQEAKSLSLYLLPGYSSEKVLGQMARLKIWVDSNFGLVLVLYTGGTIGMKLNSDKGKLAIVSFLFCAYIVLMILSA